MSKKQIFSNLIDIVSSETELSKDSVLSNCKEPHIVDAKYLLVYFLYKEGFYPSEISKLINRTTRYVNHILSSYDDRVKSRTYIRKMQEAIKNKLRNI